MVGTMAADDDWSPAAANQAMRTAMAEARAPENLVALLRRPGGRAIRDMVIIDCVNVLSRVMPIGEAEQHVGDALNLTRDAVHKIRMRKGQIKPI